MVICIGLYSNQPSLVGVPAAGNDIRAVKSSTIRSLKSASISWRVKSVAVVGYGKSATDAVLEAAAAAKHRAFDLPQRALAECRTQTGRHTAIQMGPAAAAQPDPAATLPVHARRWNAWCTASVNRWSGCTGVWSRRCCWFQCQLGSKSGSRVSLVSPVPIEIDAFGESTMVPRPDFFRLSSRWRDSTASHDYRAHYTETGVKLADGSHLDIDLLILATGWKTDFSFLVQRGLASPATRATTVFTCTGTC